MCHHVPNELIPLYIKRLNIKQTGVAVTFWSFMWQMSDSYLGGLPGVMIRFIVDLVHSVIARIAPRIGHGRFHPNYNSSTICGLRQHRQINCNTNLTVNLAVYKIFQVNWVRYLWPSSFLAHFITNFSDSCESEYYISVANFFMHVFEFNFKYFYNGVFKCLGLAFCAC
jgi:hypothetical protein